MSVVVPEGWRERVHPRRSVPGFAKRPSEKEVVRALAGVAKHYEKSKYNRPDAELFEKGLTYVPEPEREASRKAACALLRTLSPRAIQEADVETLAIAESMVKWRIAPRDHSLIAAITSQHSPALALDVIARCVRLELHAEGGYTNALLIRTAQRTWGHVQHDAPWAELRHWLCTLSDAEYAQAVNHTTKLRASVPSPARAVFASLFPDQPWWREDWSALSQGIRSLVSAVDDASVLDALNAAGSVWYIQDFAMDVATTLAPRDGVRVLSTALDRYLTNPPPGQKLKTPPRDLAEALSCIRTEESAQVFAKLITHPIVGTVAQAFFRDAPEFAELLLGNVKGKAKDAALRVLGASSSEGAVEASNDALPNVLRARSWRLAPPSIKPMEVALLGLEKGFVLPSAAPTEALANHALANAEQLAKWVEETEGSADMLYAYTPHPQSLRVPAEAALRAWNANRGGLTYPGEFVTTHGLAAAPGFAHHRWLRWLGYQPGVCESALRIVSPLLAEIAIHIAEKRTGYRGLALRYLEGHLEVVGYGVIAEVLKGNRDAASVLRWLMQRGHRVALEDVARAYGDAAFAQVQQRLEADPHALGLKPGKLPDYLRADALPALRVRSGEVLGEEARAQLIEMLQVIPADAPYVGVKEVSDALDLASLEHFLVELLETWVLSDAPGKHVWMLGALVHFAPYLQTENLTRRIGALAREWARKKQVKAERAMDALGRIGSDLALFHLMHIADTSQFVGLREKAHASVQQAAETRGLSADELGDRTVPDGGLDASGTLTLTYGPRSFVLSVSESLQPVLKDESGALLKTLPRANKDDDAALAKAARARFDDFKKDLELASKAQVKRFEEAMVRARAWTFADFETYIARHPLLRSLARGLVWQSGGLLFRVAEDGSYASASDEALTLEPDQPIWLPHPLRADLTAWSQVFSDYALIQPLPQLGRTSELYDGVHSGRLSLSATSGIEAAGVRWLGGLEARGWTRQGGQLIDAYRKPLVTLDARAFYFELPLSPGMDLTMMSTPQPQTSGALLVGDVQLEEVVPVVLFEALRDVESMRAR